MDAHWRRQQNPAGGPAWRTYTAPWTISIQVYLSRLYTICNGKFRVQYWHPTLELNLCVHTLSPLVAKRPSVLNIQSVNCVIVCSICAQSSCYDTELRTRGKSALKKGCCTIVKLLRTCRRTRLQLSMLHVKDFKSSCNRHTIPLHPFAKRFSSSNTVFKQQAA